MYDCVIPIQVIREFENQPVSWLSLLLPSCLWSINTDKLPSLRSVLGEPYQFVSDFPTAVSDFPTAATQDMSAVVSINLTLIICLVSCVYVSVVTSLVHGWITGFAHNLPFNRLLKHGGKGLGNYCFSLNHSAGHAV